MKPFDRDVILETNMLYIMMLYYFMPMGCKPVERSNDPIGHTTGN